MAQTLANINAVLKDVWTQSRLEKQFYDGTIILDKIEKTNRHTIGKQALVPLHVGRGGGLTSLSSAGGNLNAAGAQRVDTATYTIPIHAKQIELQLGALNQANGNNTSVADALDLEVDGAISDIRANANRQVAGDGTGLIAQCTTSTTTNTINLDPAGYGFDAIERGWLYEGLEVDIGTTSSEASVAGSVFIEAVKEDPADPEIQISGSTVSTDGTHYVSIANARAGATSFETNGLRNLVGTGIVGGINPSAEPTWKSYVDTTTTTVSLDLLLTLRSKVFQKTGGQRRPGYATTSVKQHSILLGQFQNQVRFDKGDTLGTPKEEFEWNGLTIVADPNIPNRELYLLSLEDFLMVTGQYNKPVWASDIGGTQGIEWRQGTTAFVDAVFFPFNIGVRRRDSSAAATALTA